MVSYLFLDEPVFVPVECLRVLADATPDIKWCI
jgi:hypothetical protein